MPQKTPEGVQKWLEMIAAYERQFKEWEGRVEKILKRYRDDYRQGTRGYTESRFNILWSNVQTIIPTVYSKIPKPDVSRRYADQDPVGRVASLIIERALSFEMEHYPDFSASMRQSVFDRFLGGRGTAWIRYEPHFKAMEQGQPVDGLEVTEDIDEANEQLDYECAPSDYVHWRDFGHSIARTWEEVTTVWRKVYLDRDQLVARFGEKMGNRIPLDTSPEDVKKNVLPSAADGNSQALIYEIWDKPSNQAIWLSKTLSEVVDEKDDPLEVEGFFPCPRPLYATITNESLVPVPDFKLYQDQANELDVLCDRIDGLIKALQVKGVYDATQESLARLFTEGENNSLLPVKNWQAFAEKNGLAGAIDLVDIKPIAEALLSAYQAMEQVQNQIYNITGLSDIVRGQSEANETATAQQIKGNYANLRLKALQDSVAQYASEIIRLKAQVMCQNFQPETLLRISAADQLPENDKALVPQAIALLKDNVLRNFRIEVAADTLVQMDEEAEKQKRVEFLTSVGGFLTQAAEVSMQAPQALPLIMELLKFGVTGFKVGKTVEGQIDMMADKLKQDAMNPKPPPPSPEEIKAKTDMQIAQQSAQLDAQKHQTQLQADSQTEQMKLQAEREKAGIQAQIEQQKAASQLQLEQAKHQMQLENDKQLEIARIEFEQWKAKLEAETKVTIAAMTAKASAKDSENEEKEENSKTKERTADIDKIVKGFTEALNQPKKIIRDSSGRATGVGPG